MKGLCEKLEEAKALVFAGERPPGNREEKRSRTMKGTIEITVRTVPGGKS